MWVIERFRCGEGFFDLFDQSFWVTAESPSGFPPFGESKCPHLAVPAQKHILLGHEFLFQFFQLGHGFLQTGVRQKMPEPVKEGKRTGIHERMSTTLNQGKRLQ